jgi:hypothetical protein
MKFSEVVEQLMAGKPVTRQSFRTDDQTTEPFIRYSELWDTFLVVRNDGNTVDVPSINFNGEMLCADDWIVGTFHPVIGVCSYENS